MKISNVTHRICPNCRGAQRVNNHVCPQCHGEGIVNAHGESINPSAPSQVSDQPDDTPETVELGWERFRDGVGITQASPAQLNDMQLAFYSGVFWVLTSMTSMFDADVEPTEKDMEYITQVDADIRAFFDAKALDALTLGQQKS